MSSEKHIAEIEVLLPKKLLVASFSYKLRASANTIKKEIFGQDGASTEGLKINWKSK